MAYSGDYTQMEDIPYKIVPGVNPRHRESVFLERAIAGERVRLAMGLSLQPVQQRTMLSEGMEVIIGFMMSSDFSSAHKLVANNAAATTDKRIFFI